MKTLNHMLFAALLLLGATPSLSAQTGGHQPSGPAQAARQSPPAPCSQTPVDFSADELAVFREMVRNGDMDTVQVTLSDSSEAEHHTITSEDGTARVDAYTRADQVPLAWEKVAERETRLKDGTPVRVIELRATDIFGKMFVFLKKSPSPEPLEDSLLPAV